MRQSIWQDLYYGKFLAAWERKSMQTAETLKLNCKIEAEKKYFMEKMSLDDCSRFQILDSLYLKSNEYEQIDAFSYGFKFATIIMSAVFVNDEILLHEHNQKEN